MPAGAQESDNGSTFAARMAKKRALVDAVLTATAASDIFTQDLEDICGGESGLGARPIHPDWVRSLRDQCHAAGVPFLFKQWGEWKGADEINNGITKLRFAKDGPTGPNNPEWHTWPDGWASARVGKKAAGRLLDGREWNEFPAA